jgi:enolase-phosphatase E1
MDEDRKSTALKALQGLSGAKATSTATLPAISIRTYCRRWKMEAQGIDLYVYSSGSVAAQKLLFGYSDEGDITHLFTAISIPW